MSPLGSARVPDRLRVDPSQARKMPKETTCECTPEAAVVEPECGGRSDKSPSSSTCMQHIPAVTPTLANEIRRLQCFEAITAFRLSQKTSTVEAKAPAQVDEVESELWSGESSDSDNVVPPSPLSMRSGEALLRGASLTLLNGDASISTCSTPPPRRGSLGSPEPGSPKPASSTGAIEPEQDTRLQSARESVKEVLLFNAAAEAVPEPKGAAHPGRAAGGRALFWQAAQCLRHKSQLLSQPATLPDMDDCGRSVAERLFFDSIPKRYVRIESIEQVVEFSMLQRFLHHCVVEGHANVEACFHGTRADCVEKILSEGLLVDTCTTAAYGIGAYVGTHAGTAHQYADPDPAGNRFMCVVLVVVGSRVVRGEPGVLASVTTVDRIRNPTQYCLVDVDRVLVSHLVKYKVVGGTGKRVGGGWDDPFQRKLIGAISRAGRECARERSR